MELKNLIVEVSRKCNANCIMCGFSSDGRNDIMSFKTFKNIFDQIQAKNVRLNGRGESTVNPEFLSMLEYAADKTQTELFTNGNYDNNELNSAFIKFKTQLFFSIDSPFKDELEKIRRGVCFEKLLRNIESQKENQTRPFLCFTLQEANFNHIKEIALFAAENYCNITYNAVRRDEGIEPFLKMVEENKKALKNNFIFAKETLENKGLKAFIPNQIAGVKIFNDDENFSNKTNASKKICPAIQNEIFVDCEGNISPCNMFNPYIYGNINEKPFTEIWNGKNRKKFIKNYKKNYYCKNCACMCDEGEK